MQKIKRIIQQKKVKWTGISCILLLVTVCLMGCGKSARSESEILEDITNYYGEAKDFLTFDSLEIIKRQTNKEDKTDTVYVTLHGQGEFAEQIYDNVLYYNYYDEGGWILDEIVTNSLSIENLSYYGNEEELEKMNSVPNDYISGTYTTIEFEGLYEENLDETNRTYYAEVPVKAENTQGLKYHAELVYYIAKVYDGENGVWVDNGSHYKIHTQMIDNIENIIWKGSPNENGYYDFLRLTKLSESTWEMREKDFTSEDENMTYIMDKEIDALGYRQGDYYMYMPDFIAGYASIYRLGREEPEGRLVINSDGSLYNEPYNITYTIYSTEGEEFSGNTVAKPDNEEEDQLDMRKQLDFN